MTPESLSFIEKNKNIQDFNTFGVPCVAAYYARIESLRQLTELLEKHSGSEQSMLTLGGGSNMLFVGNYDGLILHNAFKGIEVLEENDRFVKVRVGGGMNWHRLVSYCVEQGWGGIENLALIPGTVGAAPIQNIGAYGVELEEVFDSLQAVKLSSRERVTFTKDECRFGYRNSVFKGEYKGQYLITDITLVLQKNHSPDVSYQSLSEHLSANGIQHPDIREVFEAVVSIRQSKLPSPSELGNAGSFFKNPIVSPKKHHMLREQLGEVPGYVLENSRVKVPAAWLIEQAGWRGVRRGKVGTYPRQALVIVNYGGATGAEILEFASDIRASVYEQFDIKLQPEVNVITSGVDDGKKMLTN